MVVHVASKNKHGATQKWPIGHWQLDIRYLGVRDSLHWFASVPKASFIESDI